VSNRQRSDVARQARKTATLDATEAPMVGVVNYTRPFQLCSHEARTKLEAAILARLGDAEIARYYSDLSPYAVRQHRHKCLPKMLKGRGSIADAQMCRY
jgi:hypothetical protein